MSSSWCMWCTSYPSDWKHHPVTPAENWTIKKIKHHKERIDRKEVKEARDILCTVNNPVWDFIESQNYIFPELHAETQLTLYLITFTVLLMTKLRQYHLRN
jgi:hypothetical protein